MKSRALRKSPGGRPTDYRATFARQAAALYRLGATDLDVADAFGVDQRTVRRWAQAHEEFCESQKIGKAAADDRVERSLYARATGYTYDAVKIFMPAGAKKPVVVPYREHVPPDTTAAIFWLKNRRKGDWRDRTEVEHSGTINLADRVRRAREKASNDG